MSVVLVKEEPLGPSQLIEVPVTANQQRVNFPDIQQLRSMVNQKIVIKGIDLIIPQVLSNGPITGLAAAPASEIVKISLVVYCEGWEKAQNFPLFSFNNVHVPTVAVPFAPIRVRLDNWQNVDWSKTYLQFSNGTTSVGSYAVLLNVFYERLNATTGEIIIGPA